FAEIFGGRLVSFSAARAYLLFACLFVLYVLGRIGISAHVHFRTFAGRGGHARVAGRQTAHETLHLAEEPIPPTAAAVFRRLGNIGGDMCRRQRSGGNRKRGCHRRRRSPSSDVRAL